VPPSNAPPTEPFEALFMSHYAFVCRTLAHFGVETAAVEDVAQEVFLVLHRRLADLDPSRDARSWLWGIARRVAHTHRRGTARARRRHEHAEAPPPRPGPDHELETRERARIVEAFVVGLPEKLRDVFVLAEIEGMSAPEIGQTLGIKLNTAYSRLRLARERFAGLLEQLRAGENAALRLAEPTEGHG
jgi:RNA polymerase sigma-70 factor (ECF subfamily)